ncbi:OTU-like cysteine protease family protein, partial [Trifolium medium]|nr:OTU-like cysteine protease family protein [Trifolium medium]
EFLIAEQGAEECSSNSDCLPSSQASTDGCDESHENENHEKRNENTVEDSTNDELSNSSKKTNDYNRLQPNDK